MWSDRGFVGNVEGFVGNDNGSHLQSYSSFFICPEPRILESTAGFPL